MGQRTQSIPTLAATALLAVAAAGAASQGCSSKEPRDPLPGAAPVGNTAEAATAATVPKPPTATATAKKPGEAPAKPDPTAAPVAPKPVAAKPAVSAPSAVPAPPPAPGTDYWYDRFHASMSADFKRRYLATPAADRFRLFGDELLELERQEALREGSGAGEKKP